ncbi:MAG: hypothetical protein LUC34_01160 [Campylobacter sp.]|nr:hypothetical protein [Campylobacter sp.]
MAKIAISGLTLVKINIKEILFMFYFFNKKMLAIAVSLVVFYSSSKASGILTADLAALAQNLGKYYLEFQQWATDNANQVNQLYTNYGIKDTVNFLKEARDIYKKLETQAKEMHAMIDNNEAADLLYALFLEAGGEDICGDVGEVLNKKQLCKNITVKPLMESRILTTCTQAMLTHINKLNDIQNEVLTSMTTKSSQDVNNMVSLISANAIATKNQCDLEIKRLEANAEAEELEKIAEVFKSTTKSELPEGLVLTTVKESIEKSKENK